MSKYYKTEWTKENAAERMKSASNSARTASGKLQEGFVFAYLHAEEHGDLGFLSNFYEAVIRGRWRPGLGLEYVKEAVGNIEWAKLGKNGHGFRKIAAKEGETVKLEFNGIPTRNWYDPAEPTTSEYTEDKFRRAVMNAAKRWVKDQGVNEQQINTALHEIEGQMGEHIIEWRSANASGKDERKAA